MFVVRARAQRKLRRLRKQLPRWKRPARNRRLRFSSANYESCSVAVR
jgi:hypothetical protein